MERSVCHNLVIARNLPSFSESKIAEAGSAFFCNDLRSTFAAYDAAQVSHINDMISAYQNFAQAFQTHENTGITYSVALVGNRETLVTDGVRESMGSDLIDTIQHMAPGSTSPAWIYLNSLYNGTSPSRATLLQYADEVIALNVRGVIQAPIRAFSREAYEIHKNNSNYLQSLRMPHELALVPTHVESALKANGYGVNLRSINTDFEKIMMYQHQEGSDPAKSIEDGSATQNPTTEDLDGIRRAIV